MKAVRRVGWWGKLPSRGDFVGRGLPPRWRAEWEDWLQRGLGLAALKVDREALHEHLANFAPWRYLAVPAAGDAWCGLVVGSHDRVGRAYPLTLAERVRPPVSPAACAQRLAALLEFANQPEALEVAISHLAPLATEDGASGVLWPEAPCSLWWPLFAADDASAVVADWPPQAQLLLDLLGLAEPAGS